MRFLRSRAALILAVLSVVVAGAAVGAYAWSASHVVLPGMRGCQLMRETAPQSRCVSRVLTREMHGRSAEAGLTRVDRMAAENGLVASHCHLAMHPIGEGVGKRAAARGTTPPAANGPSTCRRGFMHGVMLGYVASSTGDIADALPTLCARDQQDERGCAHVVGHLIARTAGISHAERAVAASCTTATVATDTAATRSSVTPADAAECIRGGYMEIAIDTEQPPLDTWRRRCELSPERTREECFAWLPPLASYRQLSERDAARQCDHVRSSDLRDACVRGVSRLLTGRKPCVAFSSTVSRSVCTESRGLAPR